MELLPTINLQLVPAQEPRFQLSAADLLSLNFIFTKAFLDDHLPSGTVTSLNQQPFSAPRSEDVELLGYSSSGVLRNRVSNLNFNENTYIEQFVKPFVAGTLRSLTSRNMGLF